MADWQLYAREAPDWLLWHTGGTNSIGEIAAHRGIR
jgi:hypothetical protein